MSERTTYTCDYCEGTSSRILFTLHRTPAATLMANSTYHFCSEQCLLAYVFNQSPKKAHLDLLTGIYEEHQRKFNPGD